MFWTSRTVTNMENIKPIETVYKGYKFRSRLEARWAVFFDSIGIKYLYEHEGYSFDDPDDIELDENGELARDPRQIQYLPDFYLPELNIHVEVKGCDKALENDSHKIRCALETDGPLDSGLVILGNIPDPYEIKWGNLPLFSFLEPHEGSIIHKLGTFLIDYKSRGVFVRENLLRTIYGFDNCESQSDYYGDSCLPQYVSTGTRWSYKRLLAWGCWDDSNTRPIVDAYIKARQARFEYGEKGE